MKPSDLRRHSRFLLAFGLGLCAGGAVLVVPGQAGPVDAVLVFGGVFCLAYLGLVAHLMRGLGPEGLARHAGEDDEGMRLIAPIAVGAVLVGLVAILMTLRDPGGGLGLRPLLALVTVPLGWAMIHTVMAFHYAHLFYGPDPGGGQGRAGGLAFPAPPDAPPAPGPGAASGAASGTASGMGPGIWDFIYFSFTLGMTAQTSDVAILSTGLRRTTVLHSALSFFYNTVLVALAVNAAVALGR